MTMTMRIVIVTMSKSLYFNGNYYGNYYVTEIRNISVYYYHHSTILSTLFKQQQQPKISSDQQPPPFSPSSLFVRTKH